MAAPSQVMLQGVFAAKAGAPEVARVRAWFEAHGGSFTGSGLRTFSARMDAAQFQKAFGVSAADTPKGFAESAQSAADISVPAALRDVLQMISVVPRHTRL